MSQRPASSKGGKTIRAAARSSTRDNSPGVARLRDKIAKAQDQYAPSLQDRLTALISGEYYQFLPPIPFETLKALVYSWMQGNFVAMWDVVSLMLDTWPMMLENSHSLRDSVAQTIFRAQPWALPGREPTKNAQRRADDFNTALACMRPMPGSDEKGLRDTIYQSCNAVLMPTWQYVLWDYSEKQFQPRATVWVHTRNLAFTEKGQFGFRMTIDPRWLAETDQSLHYPGAMDAPAMMEPSIPENRGLCSVYDTRSGSIAMSGFVRPLSRYWGGMYYGYNWMLRWAEMFGQPMRVAYFDPGISAADNALLSQFLSNFGSNPWAKFPKGTTFDFKEFNGGRGDDPKRWLQEQADNFCHLLFFGETGTHQVRDSGGGGVRAQGEVLERTRRKREEGIAAWEGETALGQLARHFCRLNYGDDKECPRVVPDYTEPESPKEQADTILVLHQAGWDIAENGEDKQVNLTMQEKFSMPLVRSGSETNGAGTGDGTNGKQNGNGNGDGDDNELIDAVRIRGREFVRARAPASPAETMPTIDELRAAGAEDMDELLDQIKTIEETKDPEELSRAVKALQKQIDTFDLGENSKLAKLFEAALNMALLRAAQAEIGRRA
jgi:hypothetical protein